MPNATKHRDLRGFTVYTPPAEPASPPISEFTLRGVRQLLEDVSMGEPNLGFGLYTSRPFKFGKLKGEQFNGVRSFPITGIMGFTAIAFRRDPGGYRIKCVSSRDISNLTRAYITDPEVVQMLDALITVTALRHNESTDHTFIIRMAYSYAVNTL